MQITYAVAGSACPVFVAGFRYRSIFEASDMTKISFVSLDKSLKKNRGGPTVVRKQLVVTEFWICGRRGIK
jgi:hypothetical protein